MEYLIYYKFGDCGWLILEYYHLSVHNHKYAAVLAELKKQTERVFCELERGYSGDFRTPQGIQRVYDHCNVIGFGPHSMHWRYIRASVWSRDTDWRLTNY